MGDHLLVHTALLLRNAVRPTDLVARVGGDEFALWLNGADHLTAAERAEQLRTQAPRELRELVGGDLPTPSLSIGIASRRPGSQEPLDSVMRRADLAMYEVKRNGRGHWRVALEPA
jgi:diguanylate cyclase (GGDEF)-like protein